MDKSRPNHGPRQIIVLILMFFLLKKDKIVYFPRFITDYGFLLIYFSLPLIGQQVLRDSVNHQNLFPHWQGGLQIVRQPRSKIANFQRKLLWGSSKSFIFNYLLSPPGDRLWLTKKPLTIKSKLVRNKFRGAPQKKTVAALILGWDLNNQAKRRSNRSRKTVPK